jgi:hypothetical protein
LGRRGRPQVKFASLDILDIFNRAGGHTLRLLFFPWTGDDVQEKLGKHRLLLNCGSGVFRFGQQMPEFFVDIAPATDVKNLYNILSRAMT